MPQGSWPAHHFVAMHTEEDPESPDAICMATIKSATFERDGYEMTTQCGHPRKDHGI